MTLEQRVAAAVADTPGVFGVAAHDWGSDRRLAWNADRSFVTASVIKLPILAAALDCVQRSALHLATRYELAEADVTGGAGLLKEFDPGVNLTLKDYLTAMIVVSDNSATNLVIRLLGVPPINAYLDRLGLTEIRAHRPIGLKDIPPDAPRGIGRATPRQLVRLLDMLHARAILTPALCEIALDILGRQQYVDGLPRYLPEGVTVAHKDGQVNDIRADVGIIYPPDRPPITIAVMADSLTDHRYVPDSAGWLAIGRIARVVYDAWTTDDRRPTTDD